DRELALRRDLYLEAAEAISVGVDAVGALGDLSRSVDELMGPAIDRTAAITKVYLVADEDTIAALARFVRDLSAAHARLLPRRLKVDSIRGEIDRIDRTVQEKTDLEPTRIHGLLKRRQELEGELLPAQ